MNLVAIFGTRENCEDLVEISLQEGVLFSTRDMQHNLSILMPKIQVAKFEKVRGKRAVMANAVKTLEDCSIQAILWIRVANLASGLAFDPYVISHLVQTLRPS